MDVARRIRDLMTDRDIKIRTMANKLGISESTLGGYLRADRTPPHDVLVQLADELNVSMDYLFGRTELPDLPLQLSKSERRLISELRTLSPEQKAIAANTVQFMAQQNRR